MYRDGFRDGRASRFYAKHQYKPFHVSKLSSHSPMLQSSCQGSV